MIPCGRYQTENILTDHWQINLIWTAGLCWLSLPDASEGGSKQLESNEMGSPADAPLHPHLISQNSVKAGGAGGGGGRCVYVCLCLCLCVCERERGDGIGARRSCGERMVIYFCCGHPSRLKGFLQVLKWLLIMMLRNGCKTFLVITFRSCI